MNRLKGLTLFELIITIGIILIVAGTIYPMISGFGRRQRLETSAITLMSDLQLAQQFARVQKMGADGKNYKYYGVCFFDNIGVDDDNDSFPDRQGWKILRYDPDVGTEPMDYEPPVDLARVTEIKSSEKADSPEFLENTYFAQGVTIVGTGLQIGDHVIFTPEGSATSDGDKDHLIPIDRISLGLDERTKDVVITPLTGYVEIE